MLGWSIEVAIFVAAVIVLIYITLGGLTSAIYNEVLQFFIIVASLLPLMLVALHDMGGVDGLKEKVRQSKLGELGLHAWQGLAPGHVTNPIGGDWIAMVMGLGFVLSFGYWTTNFAEVQRALSAKNMSAARRTPLIGAYPKIFIPALTIIPGLVALVTVPGLGGKNPDLQYNNAIPLLIGKLPAGGDARPGGHRPRGGVHGGRRGERDVVQHGRHLRPLAVVRPQGPRPRLLPALRPHRDLRSGSRSRSSRRSSRRNTATS